MASMGQPRVTKLLWPLLCVMVVQEVWHISRYFQSRSQRDDKPEDYSPFTYRHNFYKKQRFNVGRKPENIKSNEPDNLPTPAATKPPVYDFANSPMFKEFKVNEVDCAKIIKAEYNTTKEEYQTIKQAKQITIDTLPVPEIDLSMYMELKTSCSDFKSRRGYILHHLTEEERNFPIGVSLLLFKEFHQVEKLMRVIYRPQNFYCLHVDYSSDSQLHAAVRAYADCFPNVVAPRDMIDIVWGSFSLSEAEFVCMYELLKMGKWRYFINLTGQEFPLKTNYQMVQIFKEFRGANDIWTSPMSSQGERFERRWNMHGNPPHGITVVKGSSHIVFSREFVEFITSDRRVPDLVSFMEKTTFAEESLWTTLNDDAVLHGPGGFNGTLEESINKTWNARVKWWQSWQNRCHGIYKRSICIFGVGDVSRLVRATPILANKFYWDYQPIALSCMREWLFNRTRDEYLGLYRFDATEYGGLPNVLQRYRLDV